MKIFYEKDVDQKNLVKKTVAVIGRDPVLPGTPPGFR